MCIWGYWYFSWQPWFQLMHHPGWHFTWSTQHILNKQGDNVQPCRTLFLILEPVCCSMSGSNCCFLTSIQISQEASQMVWYSISWRIFILSLLIYLQWILQSCSLIISEDTLSNWNSHALLLRGEIGTIPLSSSLTVSIHIKTYTIIHWMNTYNWHLPTYCFFHYRVLCLWLKNRGK